MKNMPAKVHSSMYRQCSEKGFAAPVDVLMEIGVLDRKKYEDWRRGRVPYLEAVCTSNLHKLSEIMKPEKSFLRGTWSQIMGLISDLMEEPYIDDQIQIEEIWNIVEALLKRGRFEKEPWEVKEYVLKEIYENGFYDYYGVYDPMEDLANAICSTKEENLKRASIMMNAGKGYLGAEAAKLYRELGAEDKCAEYFEKHLGKEEEPYEILVDYYKDRNHTKAIEIAALAIQKCQKDQTPFFLLLLEDAKNRGDGLIHRNRLQGCFLL